MAVKVYYSRYAQLRGFTGEGLVFKERLQRCFAVCSNIVLPRVLVSVNTLGNIFIF